MIANALKKSSGINYPGLIAAWSAKGKTNDDEDRDILRDLTGNGHDITLSGFAFSEMSGYGGYQYNWLTDLSITTGSNILNITHNKLKLTKSTEGWEYITSLKIDSYKNKPFKLNVHYEAKTASVIFGNGDRSIALTEGINIIPIIDTASNIYFSMFYGTIAEIELLPEYPDALVFDGVDDYGQSIDRIKALTEYTIILKRKIIKATNGGCVLYKGDLRYDDSNENFGVEFTDNKYWYYYSGLLGNNKITPYQEDIIYAKEKSYNGQQMNSNLDNVVANPIVISTVNKTGFINMAFYSAYLFDRSLDEQEIKSFIRKYIDPEYLLPSEQTTE